MDQIYLSIIVCGRNDNYGGNFLSRVNIFISSISILSDKYDVNTEIVFVEWNPPKDSPLLSEELSKNSALNKYKQKIRFIQVSPEIHNGFSNRKENLPVLDYIGKNVGIRRSKGKFILICSPDIIFQDYFFIMMKENFFTDKYIYRAVRSDIHREVLLSPLTDEESYEKFLKDCHKSILATHLDFDQELYHNSNIDNRIMYSKPFQNGCGDFLLMARDNWFRIGGCPETGFSQQFLHLDSMTLLRAMKYFEQWILPKSFTIFHQDHDRPHRVISEPSYQVNYQNAENWGLSDINVPEFLLNY